MLAARGSPRADVEYVADDPRWHWAGPLADGSRHYPVVETDNDLALGAVMTTITYMPIIKLDTG